jgi:hypothetical protein
MARLIEGRHGGDNSLTARDALCGRWLWLFRASYGVHIFEASLAGERFYR